MKYSIHAVRVAAAAAGISPHVVEQLLGELVRLERQPPTIAHRLTYPKKRQQCSFPVILSKEPFHSAVLGCDFYLPLDKLRGRQVCGFWSEAEPTRLALFHPRAGRSDTYQQLVLEVLIESKERRNLGCPLRGGNLPEGISLRELVRRVAERGALNHSWCGGDVEMAIHFSILRPGKILAAVASLHERFRCIVVVNPGGWGDLESEVSLTQLPQIRSVSREEPVPC